MAIFRNHWKTMLLIGSWLSFCWLAMQAVHELGHVLAAWGMGASVEKVVLLPWTISRTDVSDPPCPQRYHLSGPVLGMVIPLILWAVSEIIKLPESFLLRFFAGFCLVANGVYLVAGILYPLTDSGRFLQSGGNVWILPALATPAILGGLALWNRQAKHFHLGTEKEEISSRSIAIALIGMSALIAVGFLLT